MRKFILCLMSLVMLFGCAACNPSESGESAVVVLSGFESQADLNSLRMFGILGKTELFHDKAYVKNENGSAKITVFSEPFKDSTPYLYQATAVESKGLDCSDFSDVEGVLIDMYNAQSEARTVNLRIVYNTQTNTTLRNRTSTRTDFELLPEQWTQIYYAVKRDCIPIVENAARVIGIEIGFERGEEDDVYYMDDIRLKKTKTAYTPLVVSFKENEFCSFDNAWQIEKVVCSNAGLDILQPEISMERTVTSSGTGGSLKVIAPAGYDSYARTDRYPGITFERDFTKQFPWAEYSSGKLSFDVYSPSENGIGSLFISAYADGRRYFSARAEIVPGEWVTVSYTAAEMNAAATTGKGFADMEQLFVRWGETAGSERLFYLDNFRVEK